MKSLLFIILLIPTLTFGRSQFDRSRDSLYVVATNPHLSNIIRANSYMKLAELYTKFKPDSIIEVCQASFIFIRESRSKKGAVNNIDLLQFESQLLQIAGNTYSLIGQQKQSIELLYGALAIEETLANKKEQITILSAIGNAQQIANNTEDYRETLHQILSIQTKINDNIGRLNTYSELGSIEHVNKNDSLALKWYNKALTLENSLSLKINAAKSHSKIGNIYEQSTQYLKAIDKYTEALNIYDELNLTTQKIRILNNLANCHYGLREYKKGVKIALNALEIAEYENQTNELIYLNKTISKITAAQRYYKKSLSHYITYAHLQDSVLKSEHHNLLYQQNESKIAYQQSLKEAEYNRQQNIIKTNKKIDKALSNAADNHSSNINTVLIISILLISFLIYAYRKQIKLNKEQAKTIKKQKVQFEIKTLRSKINPNFLFNGINSLKEYIIKNDSEKAGNHLTKFANFVKMVLSHSNQNHIKLSDEIKCLTMYTELEKVRFSGQFDFEVNTELNLSKYNIPPMLLHPFVENSIWHGILNKENSSGTIKINIIEIANGIKIEVIDNGVGREAVKKILEENSFRQKSLGLTQEQDRLNQLNAQNDFHHTIIFSDLYNRENESIGTKVIITLPQH